jgi:hypothetical protein
MVLETFTDTIHDEQVAVFPAGPWSILGMIRGVFQYFKSARRITSNQETVYLPSDGTTVSSTRTVGKTASATEIGEAE